MANLTFSGFILAVCLALMLIVSGTAAAGYDDMPDNMPGMPWMSPAPAPEKSGSSLASYPSALAFATASLVSFIIFK